MAPATDRHPPTDRQPQARPPRSIYIIEALDGPVKIGVAADPFSRIQNLQSAESRLLRVAYTREFPAADVFRVERQAHWLLRADRVRGEWFAVSKDGAIKAIDQAWQNVQDGTSWLQKGHVSYRRTGDGLKSLYRGEVIDEQQYKTGLDYRRLAAMLVEASGVGSAATTRLTPEDVVDIKRWFERVHRSVYEALGAEGLALARHILLAGRSLYDISRGGSMKRVGLQIRHALEIVGRTPRPSLA